MKHILWIGPRESDVTNLNPCFCGSITIFGSGQGNNRSYSKDIRTRMNHNQPDCFPDEYCDKYISEYIEKYPDLKILHYNPLYSERSRRVIRIAQSAATPPPFLNCSIPKVR